MTVKKMKSYKLPENAFISNTKLPYDSLVEFNDIVGLFLPVLCNKKSFSNYYHNFKVV